MLNHNTKVFGYIETFDDVRRYDGYALFAILAVKHLSQIDEGTEVEFFGDDGAGNSVRVRWFTGSPHGTVYYKGEALMYDRGQLIPADQHSDIPF